MADLQEIAKVIRALNPDQLAKLLEAGKPEVTKPPSQSDLNIAVVSSLGARRVATTPVEVEGRELIVNKSDAGFYTATGEEEREEADRSSGLRKPQEKERDSVFKKSKHK